MSPAIRISSGRRARLTTGAGRSRRGRVPATRRRPSAKVARPPISPSSGDEAAPPPNMTIARDEGLRQHAAAVRRELHVAWPRRSNASFSSRPNAWRAGADEGLAPRSGLCHAGGRSQPARPDIRRREGPADPEAGRWRAGARGIRVRGSACRRARDDRPPSRRRHREDALPRILWRLPLGSRRFRRAPLRVS